MSRKVPGYVKRRRFLIKQIERAETHSATNHYMALLARMTVGYDPSRDDVPSPRRG